MAGKKVFISHTSADHQLIVPLLAALDAWEIAYSYFAEPAGGAQQIPAPIQAALSDCAVFLRICTVNTAQSYPMNLEVNIFRSLQAEDRRHGRADQRTLVNLILDPRYIHEPFEKATLFIDATARPRHDWLQDLARPLGITTAQRRFGRRAVIGLGAAAAVTLVASSVAGITLLENPSTPPADLSRNRGQKRWSIDLTFKDPSPSVAFALANHTVYAFEDNGLSAFNTTDGKRRWQNTTYSLDNITQPVTRAPAYADGVLYFSDDNATVYAARASDGTMLWKQQSYFLYPLEPPVVAAGSLYIIGEDGQLYAFATKDGTSKWNKPINANLATLSAVSAPTVVNQNVYIGSDDHYVYNLNANDGSVVWKFLTRGPVLAAPVVVNGVVYVNSSDGYCYALHAGTGAQIWKFQTGFDIDAAPVVRDGVIYVASRDGYVYAIATQDGQPFWRAVIQSKDFIGEPLDETNVTPALGTDAVYQTRKNLLYAYNIRDGSSLWIYTSAASSDTGNYSSPIYSTDNNGMVIYLNDTTIYAVNA